MTSVIVATVGHAMCYDMYGSVFLSFPCSKLGCNGMSPYAPNWVSPDETECSGLPCTHHPSPLLGTLSPPPCLPPCVGSRHRRRQSTGHVRALKRRFLPSLAAPAAVHGRQWRSSWRHLCRRATAIGRGGICHGALPISGRRDGWAALHPPSGSCTDCTNRSIFAAGRPR